MPNSVKTYQSTVNKKAPEYLKKLNAIAKYGESDVRAISHYRDKKGHSHQYVPFERYSKNISDLLNYCTYSVNYFITFNGIDGRGSGNKNIKYLRAFWIDVDLKKLQPDITKNLALNKRVKSDVLYAIPKLFDDAEIPQPTAIDDSGYGFHLIYIFERQVPILSKDPKIKKHFRAMWAKTMYALTKRMNIACAGLFGRGLADPRAMSISKILRIPNTLNCKYGHRVPCRNLASNGRYFNFFDMYCEYGQREKYSDYLKYRRRAQAKYDAIGREMRRNNVHNKHFYQHSNHVNPNHYCRGTLYKIAINDVKKLPHLRHGRMVNCYKGNQECAENALFYFAVNYVHLSHDKNIKYDLSGSLHKLNSEFKNPRSNAAINKLLRESKQDYFWGYGYPGAKNYISKARYVVDLGINEQEQKFMGVLIGASEKKARRTCQVVKQRTKRRKASRKHGFQAKRTSCASQTLTLHKEGLSVRKIAKKLGIGKSTVSRYLNEF